MTLKTRFLIIVIILVSGLAAISGLSGYLLSTMSQLKKAEMVCHDAMHTLMDLKRLNNELLFSETLDESFADWRMHYSSLKDCMQRLDASPQIAGLLKTGKQQAMIKAMNNFWKSAQDQLDRVDRGLAVHFAETSPSRDGLIYQYMNTGDYRVLTLKNKVSEAALYLSSEFESKLSKLINMVELEIKNRRDITIKRIILVGLIIGVCLFSILIAFFIKINRSFMAWYHAMEKIGKGEFPEKFPDNGDDEFSKMSKAINRASDNLKVIHQELEQRIADLSRARDELREREAQRRQIMKAKSLMRMAGAIAHKFNNHLQAVMGNLEMAIVDESGGGEIPKTLTAALESAGRAAELSRLMLTYTGKAAGKVQAMDLSDCCRMALPLFKTTLPEKIILKTSLPSPGPIIKSNPDQIQQVITALLENASESMAEDQGEIDLAVKTVNSGEPHGTHRFPIEWEPMATAHACLEISDSGSGIAADCIEDIFDPFFSTNFTGRGLGLPVVLGIAAAHNGCVTVESKTGKGSIFRVFFPIANLILKSPHPALSPLPKGGGGGSAHPS